MESRYIELIKEIIGFYLFSFSVLFQMMMRGIIIYFLGLTIARFNKKLLGVRTPFNFILFVIFGSIFANAIVDAKLFLPIIGTMILLISLNGFMTMLAYYFPLIESFVKGHPSVIVKKGKIQWDEMEKNFITEQEVLNELHAQLHVTSLEKIEYAFLESDGTITFIKKEGH